MLRLKNYIFKKNDRNLINIRYKNNKKKIKKKVNNIKKLYIRIVKIREN